MEYDDLVSNWTCANHNDYQKHISSKSKLHKNSIEIINVLINCGYFSRIKSVFELGCGCGRNLHYLLKQNEDIKIYGNDLSKKDCFKYMEPDVKNKIVFFEKDTLNMVLNDIKSVDMILSSDHLMHLPVSTVKEIVNRLKLFWKPNLIVMRDSVIPREKFPCIYIHDYISMLSDVYSCVFEDNSKISDIYRIRIFQRNNSV